MSVYDDLSDDLSTPLATDLTVSDAGLPVNTTPPAISPTGPVLDGATLTYVPGFWIDADTVTHEWRVNGVATGSTAATFDTTGHAGSTITVRETATNTHGVRIRNSAGVYVTEPVPTNDTPPSITPTGPVADGATLTYVAGSWTGANAVTHEWYVGGTPTGQTGPTYDTTGDGGESVTVVETATNFGGSTQQASAGASVVSTPVNDTPPSITPTGPVADGAVLTYVAGSWTGADSVAHEWYLDGSPTGVTTGTYDTTGDAASTVSLVETATNIAGGEDEPSSNSVEVTSIPVPVNTVPPSITPTGPVADGAVLTYVAGTWTGADSVTHEWHVDGFPSGETGATYDTAGDGGSVVSVVETATNAGGSDDEPSSNGVTVVGLPVNNTPPGITPAGTAGEGDILTYVAGSWTGADTVTHEWYADAVATGQTGPAYDTTGHAGEVISIVEIASNLAGSQPEISNVVPVVALPVNTVPPAVTPSGTVTEGTTLSYTAGSWTGAGSVTHEWYSNGSPTGQTGATFDTAARHGEVISVVEAATNAGGSETEPSNLVSVLALPVNTVPPNITPVGPVADGAVLTYVAGSWTGAASVDHEWYVGGSPTGVTTGTYDTTGDGGSTVTLVETATNAAGSEDEPSSNGVAVISAPVNTVPPSITPTGTVNESATLTYVAGTWTGVGVSVDHEWYADGSPTGQTGPTLSAAGRDGETITVVETATNVGGSEDEPSSNSVDVVAIPVNTVPPSVTPTGPVADGAVLTYVAGTWTGASTVTHEWYADGFATGVTTATYDTTGDAGEEISVAETATNAGGSDTEPSSNDVDVVGPPVNTVPASITPAGPVTDGATLTYVPGTWTFSPTLSHEWYVDAVATGQTGSTYDTTGDGGSVVSLLEEATNVAGTDDEPSSNSVTVNAAASDFRYSITGIQASFRRADDDSNCTIIGGTDIDDLTDLIPQANKTVSETEYTLTAPSESDRPTIGSDGRIVFDGAGDQLTNAASPLAALVSTYGCTVFLVVVDATTAAEGYIAGFFDGTTAYFEFLTASWGLQVYNQNTDGGTLTDASTYASPPFGDAAVLAGSGDTGEPTHLYIDGGSAIGSTVQTLFGTGLDRTSFGGSPFGTYDGTLCEMLVCLGALSDAEVTSVSADLRDYWEARGITFP